MGKLKHGLPLLEPNQDRTACLPRRSRRRQGCDPGPEHVGRVPLVRATRSEIYHLSDLPAALGTAQAGRQAGHGGH